MLSNDRSKARVFTVVLCLLLAFIWIQPSVISEETDAPSPGEQLVSDTSSIEESTLSDNIALSDRQSATFEDVNEILSEDFTTSDSSATDEPSATPDAAPDTEAQPTEEPEDTPAPTSETAEPSADESNTAPASEPEATEESTVETTTGPDLTPDDTPDAMMDEPAAASAPASEAAQQSSEKSADEPTEAPTEPTDQPSGDAAAPDESSDSTANETPPDPTAAPTDEPEPTATPVPNMIVVIEGASEDEEHIWHLRIRDDSPLKIRWACALKADEYDFFMEGSQTSIHQKGPEYTISIEKTELVSGLYTIRATSYLKGSERASVTLRLQLTIVSPTPSPEPTDEPDITPTPAPEPTDEPDVTPTPAPGPTDEPVVTPTPAPGPTDEPVVTPTPEPEPTIEPEPTSTPRPTFPPYHPVRPGGRGKGGGSSPFIVIPGKALISTHASGTGDMTVYGTVPLELDSETMSILCMGGQALEVSRGGEIDFHASLDENVLTLTSDEDGVWYFTQYALQTLSRSGLSTLSFSTADGEVLIPTDMTLSGSAYGRERSNGFVASDFLFALTDDGLYLSVEDRDYTVTDGVLTMLQK